MKMGFLFDREIRKDFAKDKTFSIIKLPEYFAWHYGPFSKDLLNDLEFLINQQYVSVVIGGMQPLLAESAEYKYWIDAVDDCEDNEYYEESFSLTEIKGIEKGSLYWEILSENQREIMIKFKRSLCKAPLTRIIEYVYKKYKGEGMIDKSLIKDKYA